MPIKPENKSRYPADWPAISLAAKARAAWACLHPGCSAKQYDVGWWNGPRWVRIHGPCENYKEARQLAAEEHFARFGDEERGEYKILVIVLTTAHLNHDPTDCAPANLAPMCQRHHLAYDAEHHKNTAYRTRKAAAQTADLFEA